MGRALDSSSRGDMLGMSIQSETAAPESEKNRPDRHLSCQEAIEQAFQAVAEMARRSGWSTGEIAAALVDLADNHMLALAAQRDRPQIEEAKH